jgi:hypothetical protein
MIEHRVIERMIRITRFKVEEFRRANETNKMFIET